MMFSAVRPCLLLAFAVLLVSGTDAAAQGTKTTSENELPPYVQYEQTNQQVAEAYAAAIGYLEGQKGEQAYHQKNILTTAQLSWMNYRGNHCQLVSGQPEQGKTGLNDAYYHCIAEINRQRHSELKALLVRFRQDFPAAKNQ